MQYLMKNANIAIRVTVIMVVDLDSICASIVSC